MAVLETLIIGIVVAFFMSWFDAGEKRPVYFGWIVIVFGVAFSFWFYSKEPLNADDFYSKEVRINSVSQLRSDSDTLRIVTADGEYLLPKVNVDLVTYAGLLDSQRGASEAKIWVASPDDRIVLGFESDKFFVNRSNTANAMNEQDRRLVHLGLVIIGAGLLIIVMAHSLRSASSKRANALKYRYY